MKKNQIKLDKISNFPKKPFNLSKSKLKITLIEHEYHVFSLAILKDGRLASCSGDKTIKVFSLENFSLEIIIGGNKDSIVYITVLTNGYLASSSDRPIIKIWEINRKHYQCIKTLRGHYGSITKVIQISRERIASCSIDTTIRIWSSKFPYECNKIIETKEWMKSIIELKNQKFLVSANGSSVFFWNSLNFLKEKTLKNISSTTSNSLFESERGFLLVGGEKVISKINANTLQLETKIMFNDNIRWIYSFAESDDKIICGCYGKLIQFDEVNQYTIFTIVPDAHIFNIYAVIVKNNLLISCSWDKTIKIWES